MKLKALFIYLAIVVVCGGVNALTYYLLYDGVSRGQWVNSFLSGVVVAVVVAWVRHRHEKKMEEWNNRASKPGTKEGGRR